MKLTQFGFEYAIPNDMEPNERLPLLTGNGDALVEATLTLTLFVFSLGNLVKQFICKYLIKSVKPFHEHAIT